jgi:hypothetical protein
MVLNRLRIHGQSFQAGLQFSPRYGLPSELRDLCGCHHAALYALRGKSEARREL